MANIFKKKIIKTLFVSLLISVIVTILLFSGFLNTWESKISDSFYYPGNPLSDIIIVEIDDESIYKLGEWPLSRDHYATVIENLNGSKVIGMDIIFDIPRNGDEEFAQVLKNYSVVLAIEYKDLSFKNGEIYAENLLKPNDSLGTPNQDFDIGFVNLYTDDDKVTRSINPKISSMEEYEPFSSVIVKDYSGVKTDLGNSRMLIKFYSEPRGYQYVSFYDVYNNSENLPDFKGKIILIGYTASGVDDTFLVPISDKAMPGVEIHANLIQSILWKDYINYQDDFSSVAIIFFFAILTGLLIYKFKIYIATILLLAFFLIYFLISIMWIFDNFGIILNILFPLFTIVLVYPSLVVLYYQSEEKQRKWITSIFGKYVSPVVIENMIKNPKSINLGGEKKNITIFFSDIRGFTSISEKLEPEILVNLLNEYLSEMTSIIINNQGLVDKYMGDAIMALWGAPLDLSNHEELACSSSLEMIGKLKELQKKWKKEEIPSFEIGIGLNSGDVVVGNMGSSKRFDYTAMGDNVNLASRMEGLNKIYGTNIIITEKTYKKINEKFETRKLDAVKVKGKKKPIHIYELVSQKGNISKNEKDFIDKYEAGLEDYFKKDWKKAMKSFNDALKLKDDEASRIFINRCKQFLKNPPSKDWDGVWEMKIK